MLSDSDLWIGPILSVKRPVITMKWILRHPLVLAVMTMVFALLAAVLEQSIAVWFGPGPWSGVKVVQDFIRNGFLAGLLTLMTSAIKSYQDAARLSRAHSHHVLGQGSVIALALTGWSNVPSANSAGAKPEGIRIDRSALEARKATAVAWRENAALLDSIRTPEVDHLYSLSVLAGLRWKLLGDYAAEGGRQRRLLFLTRLIDDLAAVESSPDLRLSAAAHTFRIRATVLLGLVHHTDSTIVERLLVERFTPLTTAGVPKSSCLFALYSESLDSSAISHDPLYLLLFHLDRTYGTVDLKSPDAERVELIVNQVRRTAGALINELRAAADLTDALVELAEQAMRIDGSLVALSGAVKRSA